MPLIDITNPEIIKFLVESYDKTARLRMKWNNIHGEKLKQAATLQREEKGYFEKDVIITNMAAGMPTITRDFKSGAPNRRLIPIRDTSHIRDLSDLKKVNPIVDTGLGDPKVDPRLGRPITDLTPDPLMRPVDPNQTKIIYKDSPDFGREVYLKTRSKMAPEDKYYFSITSGWDYGWRINDSYFSKNAPKHGRVWRLHKDLQGRSGPHPDPAHYTSVEVEGLNKCTF